MTKTDITLIAPLVTALISAIIGVVMLKNGVIDISLWCINYAGMIGMVYIVGGIIYVLAEIVDAITEE